jgi:hypothetical protein
MQVPLTLAEKAFEHEGRKFLLIQSATIVEVEATDGVGSPTIINGMVVFPDTNNPPLTIPGGLGVPLPNWNTVVLWPWVAEGGTLEEQLSTGRAAVMASLARHLNDTKDP